MPSSTIGMATNAYCCCNSYLPKTPLQSTKNIIKINTNAFFFNNTCSSSFSSWKKKNTRYVCRVLPVDPWAPSVDSQSIASTLFAASLFPYLGFLYFITKSNTSPKLTLFGFYFLLVFVGATIPAGIYAKVHYGTSLANVDWLHGGAESLLTITNLLIVLGLRDALRKIKDARKETPRSDNTLEEKQSSL